MSKKSRKIILSCNFIIFLSLIAFTHNISAKPEIINQNNVSPPNFIPLTITSVANYSAELRISEPIEILMNSGSNIFVLVAFGSSEMAVYNSLVVIAEINNSLSIQYAFANNIITQPLVFTPASSDIVQLYSNDIIVTFSEYGSYGNYPTLVSSIMVMNNETLFQFESDLYSNLNFNYQPYLSLNAVTVQSSIPISSSAVSSSSSQKLSGFDFTLLLVIFPVFNFYKIKKKKLN